MSQLIVAALRDILHRLSFSLILEILTLKEAALFDERQREERVCGTGTTLKQNGSLIALFHEA